MRNVASWILAMLVPLALIGAGVRTLLTHTFLQIEYGMPGFPPDEYGFSMADRLHWGAYGIDYLLNNADISFLGNLQLADGMPLFNARELSHMRDVKRVTHAVLEAWCGVLALLVGLGVWAWRAGWWTWFRRGLRWGGEGTLLLALAVGIVGTIGASGSGDLFWQFFSDFHGLFFSGDSWLFAYSDSLIRLYPIRFWQDAVLYIGIIAATGALALVFLTGRPRKPGA
jgi:integral membrane protein (TIGR01906 family)